MSADAFSRALAVQKDASQKGLDWPDPYGVLAKIREELDETEEVVRSGSENCFNDEVGDLLFSVVNVARMLDVDPERALSKAINKFERRFQEVRALARGSGRDMERMSIEELDVLWEEAKRAGPRDG
jgi:uncharacterized protein YabN with tetrapyrrole methylase and pyrophosphatase domain